MSVQPQPKTESVLETTEVLEKRTKRQIATKTHWHNEVVTLFDTACYPEAPMPSCYFRDETNNLTRREKICLFDELSHRWSEMTRSIGTLIVCEEF